MTLIHSILTGSKVRCIAYPSRNGPPQVLLEITREGDGVYLYLPTDIAAEVGGKTSAAVAEAIELEAKWREGQ